MSRSFKNILNLQFISFTTKISRFLLVGISGFLLNYLVSYSLVHGPISNIWYIHATIIGIALSTTSNFILNKYFTFRDRNFGISHTAKQYGFYTLFTLVGTILQLSVIWILVEIGYSYATALILGVILGSFSNFILNKKWTFQERIWH